MTSERLAVRKTYKLWIGGAFVRSESGRYDESGGFNFPRASRKDVRDAVAAARKASGAWAARTAYNRGQILYRAAEALESRAGVMGVPRDEVDASVDVLLHYAGWTDKIHAVLGGVNPVAAPFLSFSLPEPTGVVGIVAPDAPPLLGLVAELAPVLAAGNVAVAILSEAEPLAGLDFAEALGRLGRSRGRREPALGPARRAGESARRPSRSERDRRRRRRRRAVDRARQARRRDDQARPPRRRGDELRGRG